MSTNSTISIENPDGSIRSIYCHWDGHLEYVGMTLKEHYNTVDKINQLLDLGFISSLDNECSKPENHSFANRIDGFTVSYHRDRGESWDSVKPQIHSTFIDFKFSGAQEYNYLFRDGKWMVSRNKFDNFVDY